MRRLGRLMGAPLRWSLVALLSAYRATIGRLLVGRCRFHPSCSTYALEAIQTHGALKGMALASWRVARCSPLTSGGLDPVPPAGTWRSEHVV